MCTKTLRGDDGLGEILLIVCHRSVKSRETPRVQDPVLSLTDYPSEVRFDCTLEIGHWRAERDLSRIS